MILDQSPPSSVLSVYLELVESVKKDNKYRWEFCPNCQSGFPSYLGLKKGYHEFSCDMSECEMFFRVEDGKGNYDLRLGMELDPTVIYLQLCDGCKRQRPVKLINLRFLCRECLDRD